MKRAHWLRVVVFLAASIPTLLLLNLLGWGGEYRLWIALGIGALASAFSQRRMAPGDDGGPGEQR